jgi:hypothetical protein
MIKMKKTKEKNEVTVKVEKNIPVEKLEDKDDMIFFKCPGCGSIHFRHAGYLEAAMPYVRVDRTTHIASDSLCVKTCVKCRKSYVYYEDKFIDVTEHIDLEAWEKFEKEAYKATGPGGEC